MKIKFGHLISLPDLERAGVKDRPGYLESQMQITLPYAAGNGIMKRAQLDLCRQLVALVTLVDLLLRFRLLFGLVKLLYVLRRRRNVQSIIIMLKKSLFRSSAGSACH